MSLSTRTFGVEVEFGHNQYSYTSIKPLIDKGGFTGWSKNITSDGSGIEVRGPVLKGDDGLQELALFLDYIKANGACVGDQDGMHVHHGCGDVCDAGDVELVKRLLEGWCNNQALINHFLPRRRYTGDWADRVCRPINKRDLASIFANIDARTAGRPSYGPWDGPPKRGKLEGKALVKYCASGTGSRFRAINVHSLHKQETIEIRQLHGTLNPSHAVAWVAFGQRFIEHAMELKYPMLECSSPERLLITLGVEKDHRDALMEAK